MAKLRNSNDIDFLPFINDIIEFYSDTYEKEGIQVALEKASEACNLIHFLTEEEKRFLLLKDRCQKLLIKIKRHGVLYLDLILGNKKRK